MEAEAYRVMSVSHWSELWTSCQSIKAASHCRASKQRRSVLCAIRQEGTIGKHGGAKGHGALRTRCKCERVELAFVRATGAQAVPPLDQNYAFLYRGLGYHG